MPSMAGRASLVGQRLEAQLEVGQRLRIEQLAQLLLAEQLAQQVAIEGQGAGASFGERRVAVVHVGRDVVEHEAARERRRMGRLDDCGRRSRGWRRRPGSRAGPAGRRRPTGTRGRSRRGSGTSRSARRPRAGPPTAGAAARAESACRAGGAGRSSARAAFSRNRLANRADVASWPTTRSSTSSASGNSSASMPSSGASPSGSRMAIPSSDQIVWTSSPSRSPMRASSASDQGAWTRPPNGVRRHSRQSPSSSRNRSTTIRLSVGRTLVTSRSSSRYASRLSAAQLVEVVRLAQAASCAACRPLRPAGQVGLELADEGAQRAPELDRPADRVALPERQLARHARAPG